MSALLDDISRITASPISRRETFKLVGGAVGGALLAYLGLGRASRSLGAPVTCPSNRPVLCNGNCYPRGYSCCGPTVCDTDDTCCTNHCCEKPQTCCGSTCCPSGQTCINGSCCNAAHVCSGKCCTSGQMCINGTCCSPAQVCSFGRQCCPAGQVCCGNRCVKQNPSGSTPCFA